MTALAAWPPVVAVLAISVGLLVQSCRIYRRAGERSEQALSMYRRADAGRQAARQAQETAEALLREITESLEKMDLRRGLN